MSGDGGVVEGSGDGVGGSDGDPGGGNMHPTGAEGLQISPALIVQSRYTPVVDASL